MDSLREGTGTFECVDVECEYSTQDGVTEYTDKTKRWV